MVISMKRQILTTLLICMTFLPSYLLANPTQPIEGPRVVTIATDSWLGYTNRDGSGYYFDILKRVFPEKEWQLQIDIVPFSRVRYLVDHNRTDMALGFYSGDTAKALYSHYPVEVDSVDAAITPEMAVIWKGAESLSHKKVQALLAYRYDEFISVPMYYEESSNLLEMMNRVNRGQVDAVLDYKPVMLTMVPKLNQPRQFVIIENVFRTEIYFVFSDNERGAKLKRHFDSELKKLIDSGELDELFRHYVGPDAQRLHSSRE
ncbi:transporter substrate-binding domain-containing protein [Shewanella atlantica]|uniref:Transporter substrate-binding domain-containing protein n=2 Tax=Shewanella atlantica TaxID=271099 RepID=A0A431VXY4_9GAMM|nr:transporter substrate-binding domain-containing protein [Shewanella atlantica]